MNHPHTKTHFPLLFPCLFGYALLLLVVGLCLGDLSDLIPGLVRIVITEDNLITDYVKVAGPGPALVNAALVTASSTFLLYSSHESHNGMTLVVTGLMSGFALFGKNLVNSIPILMGTWLYAKLRGETFSKYTAIGLMSTALSPIVSYIALNPNWGALWKAVLVGCLIGFILPPLSTYTYRIQNGMNLYNMGFACGLVAFILVPIISSLGANPATRYDWAQEYSGTFALLLSFLCVLLIFVGFFLTELPTWAVWAGYRNLLLTSGRAPSDFLRMFGSAPVLVNMGVNGLIGIAFTLFDGGTLNGPTVGGILTIMGFSAFGKHAGNIIPVMSGVYLSSLIMNWSLSDPSVQLARLFCTTLAPISGYFGWPYGILAGFIHSCVVLYTGSPVAGMNLYNNGFSGGLVAIVLYPVILAAAKHRKPVPQDEDYFDAMEDDSPIVPPDHKAMVEESDVAPKHPENETS